MSASTSHAINMKDAIKRAVQENTKSGSHVLTDLFTLLHDAEAGLHESRYRDAVLELRQGKQTDFGLRYTAYLSNESGTFENQLFSVFVGDDRFAFQADGLVETGLSLDELLERASNYLLKPNVIEYMIELLRQFERPVFLRDSTGITVPFNMSKIDEILNAPAETRLDIVKRHISGWNIFAGEATQMLSELMARYAGGV